MERTAATRGSIHRDDLPKPYPKRLTCAGAPRIPSQQLRYSPTFMIPLIKFHRNPTTTAEINNPLT